jgi:hypothetical protein
MKSLKRTPYAKYIRAAIEVAFIIFLFYSNLLMGEFNGTGSAAHKTLLWALNDIFTWKNLVIAFAAALIGYGVFEFLRRKV